MARAGLRIGRYGVYGNISKSEGKSAVVPALVIGVSAVIVGVSAALIYHKHKTAIDNHYKQPRTTNTGETGVDKGNEDSKKDDDIQNISTPDPMEPIGQALNKNSQKVDFLSTNVLRHGGILVMFGPKGMGKTTLAMQLVFCIAEGKLCDVLPIEGVTQQPPQIVFYYDLEMQPEQIKERYGEITSENIRWDNKLFGNISDWLDDVEFQSAPERLSSDATIVIDNITKCGTGQIQPDVITKMFNRINKIQENASQRGIHLSFIIIAHSTNVDLKDKPLSLNDLAGNSNLSNFADAVVGIAPTRIKEHRLIKVFTNRNHPEPNQVLLVERGKVGYHLSFIRKELVDEQEVLPYKNARKDTYENFKLGKANETAQKGQHKKYTDEQILEFHKIFLETGNKSEAYRQTGVPRQIYDARIGKLFENQ